MADHVEQLITHLHERRFELEAAVRAVPEHQRDVAPASGGWSVLQMLDHVARVDSMVARLLHTLMSRAAPIDATSPIDVPAAIARMQRVLDRSRRVDAVLGSEPAESPVADSVQRALEHARAELLAAVAATAGRDITSVTYAHPILGPLSLLEWVVFVGNHDARHAAQLRENAG
jgi:uncharacterized damage-inducible protein DinB